MFEKPSLMLRISIGKALGVAFGAAAFFLLPLYGETDLVFRIGILFWLATTGAFVGIFGVMTHYPVLNMPMPWWLRGPMVGGFLMLNLWLVARERLDAIAVNMMGTDSVFSSGAWVIADGLVIGLIMAAFITFFGGEGKETVGR